MSVYTKVSKASLCNLLHRHLYDVCLSNEPTDQDRYLVVRSSDHSQSAFGQIERQIVEYFDHLYKPTQNRSTQITVVDVTESVRAESVKTMGVAGVNSGNIVVEHIIRYRG